MVMANYYETVVPLDTDTGTELERKWHVWAERESRIRYHMIRSSLPYFKSLHYYVLPADEPRTDPLFSSE